MTSSYTRPEFDPHDKSTWSEAEHARATADPHGLAVSHGMQKIIDRFPWLGEGAGSQDHSMRELNEGNLRETLKTVGHPDHEDAWIHVSNRPEHKWTSNPGYSPSEGTKGVVLSPHASGAIVPLHEFAHHMYDEQHGVHPTQWKARSEANGGANPHSHGYDFVRHFRTLLGAAEHYEGGKKEMLKHFDEGYRDAHQGIFGKPAPDFEENEHTRPYGGHTATAFFRGAYDAPEGGTHERAEHGADRPGGRGGDPAARGHVRRPHAGRPDRAAGEGRRVQAAAGEVERHPELQGDLDRLGGGARHVQDTIEALQHGRGGVTSYPLDGALQGWHAAYTNGGHQVVHKVDPDTKTLHVGYAGHNLADAEERLKGSSSEGSALPVEFHKGAEKDFDKLHHGLQDKALDVIDRLSRREPAPNDHAMGANTPLKGWHAAHIDFLHRVTHRYEDNDGNSVHPNSASRLFIGHIGPHNYDDAIRRLTVLTATAFFRQAVEGDTPDGTLARGMNVVLPGHIHDFVHDERQPLPARAHMLLSELKKPTSDIHNEELQGSSGGLGEFWTRNHMVSDDASLAQHENRPEGERSTTVTLHAHEPGSQHFWREMSGYDDHEGNWRVPLKPGTPLGVHAITWGEPGGQQHHYDFSAPVDKQATLQRTADSPQTQGHYEAEHRALDYHPEERQYRSAAEAQQHANEITDKEGLPRVHVSIRRTSDHSRYLIPNPDAKTPRGRMPQVQLHHGMLNEHTLIHELAHHKHITEMFPGYEPSDDAIAEYQDDDPDGHGEGFQKHYHQMISDHHSEGRDLADDVRYHAQKRGVWKAAAVSIDGDEGVFVISCKPARPGISATAYFRTASGQQEWYHGSGAAFDRFDLDKSKTVQDESDSPRHWNSHLGAHFSSDPRVAQEFAQRQGGGHVYHVQLGLQNPKHYESEHDLDKDAVLWAHHNGHDMGPSVSNPAYREHIEPDEWQFFPKYDDHGEPRPDTREIAHGFREHLKSQGHDGITYGNEFEGAHNGFHAGERHLSAIAFDPDQITITQRRAGNEPRTAAVVDNSGGVMVAFVPPREIAEQLAQEGGQPVDDLHITLAYLGNAADYEPALLKLLPQYVGAWAARHNPVTIRVGGKVLFNNEYKDQHVLGASVGWRGDAQMHTRLAQFLEGHGYRLPSEHGWTPHMTLRYVDKHFRFMPHLEAHSWEAPEVVVFIGGNRHSVRFGGRPSTHTTL
jgi:2'-5' RNA ligase